MSQRHRRPNVTLDQLHTFAAVAELEHLGRAAEAIHRSPAATSEQVRLLERTLGVPLFERVGRGIRVTPVGRGVLRAAVEAVIAVRTVEDIAAAHRGLERGELAISASNIMGTHRLPRWIKGYIERHPGIDVQVRLDNMEGALAALGAGSIDCAIVGGDVPRAEFETLLLERDELVIAVAAHHPLAQTRSPLAQLSRHRYLSRGTGSGTELLARRVLGRAYLTGPVLRLGQGAVQPALLAGLGYAVMPRVVVDDHVAAGTLCILPRRDPPVMQDFTAVRRAGPSQPALEAFWTHLSELVASSPAAQDARAGPRRAHTRPTKTAPTDTIAPVIRKGREGT